MIKSELVWHDKKEYPNRKAGGQYLVIRNRPYSLAYFEILHFQKSSHGLYNANYNISKKAKNLWFYYDSEYGDIIVDDVLFWAELPDAIRLEQELCK